MTWPNTTGSGTGGGSSRGGSSSSCGGEAGAKVEDEAATAAPKRDGPRSSDDDSASWDIAEHETFAGLFRKTAAFARRHHSINVVVFGVVFLLVDWVVKLPVEWFLLVAYSLWVLLRAQRLGISTLLLYVIGLSLGDYVVSSWLPSEITSATASVIVNAFFVVQLHGINVRGMMLLAMLVWVVLKYPLPISISLRPLAVHCTVFGAGSLTFALLSMMHESLEEVLQVLGLSMPQLPVVIVQELTATSLKVWWSYHPTNSTKACSEYVVELNGVQYRRLSLEHAWTIVKDLAPNERYVVRVGAVHPSSNSVVYSFPIIVRTPSSTSSPDSDDLDPENVDSGRESTDSGTDNGEQTLAPVATEGNPLEVIAVPVPTALTDPPPSAAMPIHTAIKTPPLTIDPAVHLEMQSTLCSLQQQRLESETLIRELQIQYQVELSSLEEEIQKIREVKKSEDNPKAKLKHSVKAVEEAKAKVDLAKAKLDKEYRSEEELLQALTTELDRLEADQAGLQESTQESEKRKIASSEQNLLERQALKAQIERCRVGALEYTTQLAAVHEQLQDVEERIALAREQDAIERSSLSQILQAFSAVKMRQRERAKFLETLSTHLSHLLEENRVLRIRLREETKRKMTIANELSAARQKRELLAHRQMSFGDHRSFSGLDDAFLGFTGPTSSPSSVASASPGSRSQPQTISPLSSTSVGSQSSLMDLGLGSLWSTSPLVPGTGGPRKLPANVTRQFNFSSTPSFSRHGVNPMGSLTMQEQFDALDNCSIVDSVAVGDTPVFQQEDGGHHPLYLSRATPGEIVPPFGGLGLGPSP